MKAELCAGVVAVDADGHIGLILASNKKQWVLPKGHQETGEDDLRVTALREAMEEMGVGGYMHEGPPVIVSHYSKTHYDEVEVEDTSENAVKGATITIPEITVVACKVTYFYRMTVLEVLKAEDREDKREMLWLPPALALDKLDYPSHRYVVKKLLGIGPGNITLVPAGPNGAFPSNHLFPPPDIGPDVPGGGVNP